jgi:HK97 gp10 family phage protein
MDKVTIKIEGFEELKNNCKQLVRELDMVGKNILIGEADHLVRVMKQKCPKDEHKIENAITKRIWKNKLGVIGIVIGVEGGHPEFVKGGGENQSYYPASQEYGWEYPKGVYHAPHPYIRPAFDENERRIKNRLRNAYKQVIDRVGK